MSGYLSSTDAIAQYLTKGSFSPEVVKHQSSLASVTPDCRILPML
uniref:Uncharacterized protein n=1 Tax=Chloracidobacterium thermophilum TaxID=458033 RepID=A8DJL3_9BACT|nr:hypothetical protein YS_M60-F11.106 [Chloracidobacterium thermophilum]